MKVHELKTWTKGFEALVKGEKSYEIREDDRNFGVGDTLILKEFDAHAECDGKGYFWEGEQFAQKTRKECCPVPHGVYSGRSLVMKIVYKTNGGEWGLPDELCVLGVRPADRWGRGLPVSLPVVCTKLTGVPCYDKAKDDEPVFVLRAQDLTSPAVICEWIKLNIETAPHDKLRQALESALEMGGYGKMNATVGGGGYETKRKRAD